MRGQNPHNHWPPHWQNLYLGAESDSDTYEEDSGEEWDTKEHRDWACCSSPLLRMGPTWAEVHATAQKQEALDRKTLMWDNRTKHNDSEESDWDRQCHVGKVPI